MVNVVDEVSDLFRKVFGENTAKLARQMYADKDPNKNAREILTMAEEMMGGFLGPANAKKQLEPIIAKYSNIA